MWVAQSATSSHRQRHAIAARTVVLLFHWPTPGCSATNRPNYDYDDYSTVSNFAGRGARQKIGDRCMRLWIIEKGSVICRQAQEHSSDEQLWKTYLTGLLSTNGMLSARSLPWLIPKLVEQWNLQHQWVKDGSYLRNGSQSVLVYRNISLPIDDIQVGEECYDAVQWAMTSGIVTNPESWPKWSVCSFACHFLLTCLLVSSLVDRRLPCLIDFYPPFSLSMLIEWNRTHLKIPRIW